VGVTAPLHPCVYRITVDERLDEHRVRLLITSLADQPYREGQRFQDRYETWMPDEREESLSQAEFCSLRAELGIPSTPISWTALDEGRVYLAGEFSVESDGFGIASGRAAFERIDHLDFVKIPACELYTSLLVRQTGAES
jgi:hypothetical protein